MTTAVVYVHGLWQSGGEASLLRKRLARALNAQVTAFTYPSVASDVTENAAVLAAFLRAKRADALHLVGHSLGGVLILRTFELGLAGDLPPGRIVLLGPPLCGSETARKLARWPWGRKILGRGIAEEVLESRPRRWDQSRDLGVIAGNLRFGAGRLLGMLPAPSDGTVTVAETELPGAADRVVLRVSHTGMLFSEIVARQAGSFLASGRFGVEKRR